MATVNTPIGVMGPISPNPATARSATNFRTDKARLWHRGDQPAQLTLDTVVERNSDDFASR